VRGGALAPALPGSSSRGCQALFAVKLPRDGQSTLTSSLPLHQPGGRATPLWRQRQDKNGEEALKGDFKAWGVTGGDTNKVQGQRLWLHFGAEVAQSSPLVLGAGG